MRQEGFITLIILQKKKGVRMTRTPKISYVDTMEFEQLYKESKGLIAHMANTYCADSHPILNREDLIAEGWLVFTRVYQNHQNESKVSFIKNLRSSLFNRFVTMLDKYRYSKKIGNFDGEINNYEENYIDLTEIAESVGFEGIMDIYFKQYVLHINEILKEHADAVILFNELIEPSSAVYERAIAEARRKTHLASQGILVRGCNIVRVKNQHIQKALNWSADRFNNALNLVKETVVMAINGQLNQNAV